MNLTLKRKIKPVDVFSMEIAEDQYVEVYIDDKLAPTGLAKIILRGLEAEMIDYWNRLSDEMKEKGYKL